MSKRASYKIPLGMPLEEQVEDINKHLTLLRERKERPINIGCAFVPTSFNRSNFRSIFEIGRAQCRRASSCLMRPARELVFALTDSSAPNGLAMSCSTFDVVLLTQGFFNKLYALMMPTAHALFEDASPKTLSDRRFREDFIRDFSSGDHDAKKDLVRLLHYTAVGFVLGHEFGHLASGHFGWANSRGALELHEGGLAATEVLSNAADLDSQAREIDADMYGGSWAAGLLSIPLTTVSEKTRIGRLVKWVQADPCRTTFLLTLSSLLAYATLGASDFSMETLYTSKTHPPTSLRGRIAADSGVIGNVLRHKADPWRHTEASQEALRVLGFGLASAFFRSIEKNSDYESIEMVRQMNSESPLELADKTAKALGLWPPTPERRAELDQYLFGLYERWNGMKAKHSRYARWKPEYRVKWSVPPTDT